MEYCRPKIARSRSVQLETSSWKSNYGSWKAVVHLPKSRSVQLDGIGDVIAYNSVDGASSTPSSFLDLEAASGKISRASSSSLGFSFSIAGVPLPPKYIVDSSACNQIETVEDVEMGGRQNMMMSEPTLPIILKFSDIKYKVAIKGASRGKEILKGISGSAKPGEVLALMGPSGGGKTTFLNVLGGRVMDNSNISGIVTYNNLPYSKPLKSRIGFVTQDDVLFPHLTVKETLAYAARLRLSRALTRKEKEERAAYVISKLGLERCQDTVIGGSFVRGVSGGERKRVCIGIEILMNPSLLFLDEPTSGLDSTTALRIAELLHDIAKAGKTVLTTIHQPSSRLFHKFDKLILLGKGSILYFGKVSEATDYFASFGCSPLIAMNPAEFLIDLANGNLSDISVPSDLDSRAKTGARDKKMQNGKQLQSDVHEYLVEAYETIVAAAEKRELLKGITMDEDLVYSKALLPRREWGASWWEQYTILFCRGLKERRHDYLSLMRVTQVLATSLILGLLWFQSQRKENSLQDQAGLLFFIAVFWGFFPVFTAIFTFPHERAVLVKERAVDMYRLSAYFMARTTSDLPLDLLLPVVFLVIVYFMAGLRPEAEAFFLSMLIVFLSIIAAQGLGLVIGATLMDIKKATTLASVTVMTFMLAGGFFVKRIPVFISWIRYLSFNYHTYRLLLKVQYGYMSTTVNGMTIGSGTIEAGALIAMVFIYRLLAYMSLRRMKLHNGA